MTGRLGIDDVVPAISGNYPAKAVVGEVFPVHATVWREGHDAVAATLTVRGPRGTKPIRIQMDPGSEPDTVDAVFVPSAEGLWTFRIEAWSDPVATWKHAVEAKLSVGQGPAELANDLEIGARLFEQAAQEQPRANRSKLEAVTASLRSTAPVTARVAPAFASDVAELLRAHPLRELVTKGEPHNVLVDRNRALFGSWYEFFPRSTGGWDENGVPKHGTFKTASEDLPRIAAMGFDVVYLPPIHPIGEINRKGRNNTLTPEPGDVGSPWAIGSAEGGHDAVHPKLGTLKDFKAFVSRARKLDLEVALDLALQCAP
ncbi:MAG: maltotransferase domain-containing protein, partial [Rhodococcus sp. (in: high G+C Gram-positive bacteria)]